MMKILLFLQEVLSNLVQTIGSLLKIVLLSRWNTKFNIDNKPGKDCIILGNGPSLNNILESNNITFNNEDLLCVNYFVNTEYYEKLKPKYYVINAPELWNKNATNKVKENSEKLFRNIGAKTSWDIFLFLPFNARKNKKWREDIGNNKHIKIKHYNNTPIEGFTTIKNLLFKFGFGLPRPHNVIIPSLIIAMRCYYKNIYLFGVDHSWLKDISVDNDNNVLINQKHFYDYKASKPRTMHKGGTGQRKLHEVLQKFVYSFRGYFEINDFATKENVNIYNCTPDSYIDAFKKVDWHQIK